MGYDLIAIIKLFILTIQPPQAVCIAARYHCHDQNGDVSHVDGRIASHFEPARPIMSYAAAAAGQQGEGRDDGDAAHAERALIHASSAALEGGMLMWGAFLQTVAGQVEAGAWKGILFIWKRRYDETPMKVRTRSQRQSLGLDPIADASLESSTHAKLLQSELSLHLLIRKETGPDRGKYFHFSGTVPAALQVLERNTGECLKSAVLAHLESIPGASNVASLFEWFCHVAIVDRYAANLRAERSLLHDAVKSQVRSNQVSKYTKLGRYFRSPIFVLWLIDSDWYPIVKLQLTQLELFLLPILFE